jgi:hypothetical protein
VRSGRAWGNLMNEVLPLDRLDVLILAIPHIPTVAIHFHELACLFVHVFELYLISVSRLLLFMNSVCSTDIVTEITISNTGGCCESPHTTRSSACLDWDT